MTRTKFVIMSCVKKKTRNLLGNISNTRAVESTKGWSMVVVLSLG